MASEASNTSMENTSSSKDESSSVDNQEKVDPELDAILDSALADFDKPKEAAQAVVNKEDDLPGAGAAESEKDVKKSDESLPEDVNYDFLADAMTKSFEDTFSALLTDPNIQKQFAELAISAEQAASSNNASAFAETVEKTLSGLNMNAESLQGDPMQQVLWEQLAETLGAEGGGGPGMDEGLGAMNGMFQNMVKQLLSKELLYQPLKEVSEKYQQYLTEKQHDLDPDKLLVYRKQLEIIDKVVEHLDGDSDDHSLEEKNSRFELLLDLLQRMHELGAPPQEVVGEGNMVMPNLGDIGGMGQLPNMGQFGGGAQDPSQCCVM